MRDGAMRGRRGITADSRAVKPGDLFVAVPGTKADGLRFVPQAARRRARSRSWPSGRRHALPDGVAFVQVANARRALALAAARVLSAPAGDDRGGDRHQRQDLGRRLHPPDLGGARPRRPRASAPSAS